MAFFFFAISGVSSAEEFYRLSRDSLFSCSSGSTNSGVAIALGRAGDVFTLLSPSGQIVIHDEAGISLGEFVPDFDISGNSTDIAIDGGTGLFVCNPLQNTIAHIGRNGDTQPPVTINAPDRFEPVSLVTLQDGRIVALNRSDGDLWRIERDGRAFPLLISPKVTNPDYAKLEISPDEKRMCLLDNGQLRLFRLQGEPLPSPRILINRPRGLAVTSEGVWVLGDGLEFIPLFRDIERLQVPVNSLLVWQVFPAADIAVNGENIVILSQEGSRYVKLSCELVRREQP
jgi:hypothetical protein